MPLALSRDSIPPFTVHPHEPYSVHSPVWMGRSTRIEVTDVNAYSNMHSSSPQSLHDHVWGVSCRNDPWSKNSLLLCDQFHPSCSSSASRLDCNFWGSQTGALPTESVLRRSFSGERSVQSVLRVESAACPLFLRERHCTISLGRSFWVLSEEGPTSGGYFKVHRWLL